MPFKAIIGCIILSFLVSIIVGSFSKSTPKSYAAYLPAPTQLIPLSESFNPPVLRGITIYPEDPFLFDFIVDSGQQNMSQEELKKASKKLIRHFLASLTIPEEDLWVNLSPYEADKIAPGELGITEMGRDMLAQDYILKQLLSSVTYPESPMGKEFWGKVYEKAYQIYGTTNIPINTFNKIWIVPEKALIYENGNSAYVLESRLKVMLEEDYVALSNNLANTDIGTDTINTDEAKQLNDISSSVMKELILPEIEKEINEGKNFAPLRQIYNSLILAVWFKDKLRNHIVNQIYTDKRKVKGVDVSDKDIKEKIYNRYLEAYKQGVYDYIKTEYDPNLNQNISRRYYSGGLDFAGVRSKADVLTSPPVGGIPQGRSTANVTVRTTPADSGGSGIGTASGTGTGSGGSSLALETEEYREQLKVQLEDLLQELKQVRADRRLLKALKNALRILEKIEDGDFAKYGYDQITEVLFHGYSHAVNNTSQAILALRNAIAGVRVILGVDIPYNAVVIVALAGMYHDVGYYREDAHGFGTIKVDHEQRSKEFVRQFAKQLGIPSSFVPLICLVISSTQADVTEDFWNQLQKAVETLLKNQNDEEAAAELRTLLFQAQSQNYAGSSLGILEDRNGNLSINQKDLSLLLGIILGAKAIASLDIRDTRENAIEVIEGLRLEFSRDKQRLLNWLAQHSDRSFTQEDIGTFQELSDKSTNSIILTAEREGLLDYTHTETERQLFARAIQELLKIHAADSHVLQVIVTKGFFEVYADGRVNGMGVWQFIDADARRSFDLKRAIIDILAEEGRIGELSQSDIEQLQQRAQQRLAQSQEDFKHRAEQAFQAEGIMYHTPITSERLAAIERAHQVGEGHSYEIGPDGRPVKHSNPDEAYTAQEIAKKARILREAGFSIEEIDALVRYGVVGNESPFSGEADGALQQAAEISEEMEKKAKDTFEAALSRARSQHPEFSDLYDKATFIIAGSVCKREATRATDVDYAIIFSEDGKSVFDLRLADAQKILNAVFIEEASSRGLILDTTLEEALITIMDTGRLEMTDRYRTIIDAKVIAGNTIRGQVLLEGIKQGIRGNRDVTQKVIDQTLEDLREWMAREKYLEYILKENKRELDFLLYVLKLQNNVEATKPSDVVSELVKKGAITAVQGRRILDQMGIMIGLRLRLAKIRQEKYSTGELQMLELKYGKEYFDAGYLLGVDTYLSQDMGIGIEEFRENYTSVVIENRVLIREILGSDLEIPVTITEKISDVMQEVPDDIKSFALEPFASNDPSSLQAALHMQIALVLIGARPAYFADRYDEIPFSSGERISHICEKYGVRIIHTGQGAIIYRQEAVQRIIDADPEFYNGLITVHQGGEAESILKAAAKDGKMKKFGGEFLGFGNQRNLDLSLGLLAVKVSGKTVLSCRVEEGQAKRLGQFYKDALERITGQRAGISFTYTPSDSSNNTEINSEDTDAFAEVEYKARQAFQAAGLRNHTLLTTGRLAAIQRAHEVGEGHSYEMGQDGRPQKHSDPSQAYTSQEIAQKARILQEAGFTRQEIDALIRHGVAGNASASAKETNRVNGSNRLSSYDASMLLDSLEREGALTYEQRNMFREQLERLEDSDAILEVVARALESVEQDAGRPHVILVNGDVCERMSHGGEAIIYRNRAMFSEGGSKYVVRLYRSSKVTREHLELYVWVLGQLRANGVPMPNAELVQVSIPGGQSQDVFGVKVGYVEGESARTAQYSYAEVPGEVSKMVEQINSITRRFVASRANEVSLMGGPISTGLADFGGNVRDAEAHYDNYLWSYRTNAAGVTERYLVPVDPIHIDSIIENADRIREAKQSSEPTLAAGNVGPSQKTGNPGGIDLNPHNLNIETRGSIDVSTFDVPFDVQSFEGFTFNIISVEAIDDLNAAAVPQDTEFRDLSYLP